MFRADAKTDDAGGDAPEEWNFCQQAHHERWFERSGVGQHPRDDPALRGDLQPLGYARGQLAAPLDPAQVIECDLSFLQRLAKNVGSRHGILNRQIDADAAHRRHSVG